MKNALATAQSLLDSRAQACAAERNRLATGEYVAASSFTAIQLTGHYEGSTNNLAVKVCGKVSNQYYYLYTDRATGAHLVEFPSMGLFFTATAQA